MSTETEPSQDTGKKLALEDRLKIWDLLIKTIGGVVVLTGGLLGYLDYQSKQQRYQDEQRTIASQKQSQEASRRAEQESKDAEEADQRKKEFRLKLYEEQRTLYHEAVSVAAKVAISKGDDAVATKRFWELYYGELCLIEDSGVETAMVAFGRLLQKGPKDQLPLACLKLTVACKKTLDLANVFGVNLTAEEAKIRTEEQAKIKED